MPEGVWQPKETKLTCAVLKRAKCRLCRAAPRCGPPKQGLAGVAGAEHAEATQYLHKTSPRLLLVG